MLHAPPRCYALQPLKLDARGDVQRVSLDLARCVQILPLGKRRVPRRVCLARNKFATTRLRLAVLTVLPDDIATAQSVARLRADFKPFEDIVVAAAQRESDVPFPDQQGCTTACALG